MGSEVSDGLPLQARPGGQHATLSGTRSAKLTINICNDLPYLASKRFEEFGIPAYHR